MIKRRFRQFIGRPDVKSKPLKAIRKRIIWRLHWMFTAEPIEYRFSHNCQIFLPKSGSASLIFYQGFSEPLTADLLLRLLKPGMIVVDIGAHIGEYSLLASRQVGESGQVHAFEPQPSLFSIIWRNIEVNNIKNITINQSVVSNTVGKLEFEIHPELSTASIKKNNFSDNFKIIEVDSTSLDTYFPQDLHQIDLIKIDVEGAELLVLQGCQKFLNCSENNAPIIIFEYAPSAYIKFDYDAEDILEFLRSYNYEIYLYTGDGLLEVFDPKKPKSGIINLLATKRKSELPCIPIEFLRG